MGEDTANEPEVVTNSFRFSVLFVCCCFYLHVCLFNCSYNVLSFSFFFKFISNNFSFNVHANINN